jgi:hypothetical protein
MLDCSFLLAFNPFFRIDSWLDFGEMINSSTSQQNAASLLGELILSFHPISFSSMGAWLVVGISHEEWCRHVF